MAKKLTAGVGKKTKKGTPVTQAVQDAANADAAQLEVIEDNTQQVLAAIPTAIAKALETIGLAAQGYAIKLCPVDTGRLRNSITHAVMDGENAVYIGTNVEYAPDVELGNHKYPGANDGRGFLRPAAQDHADEYVLAQ